MPSHQGGVGLAGPGIAGQRHPPAGHGNRGGVSAVQRRLRVADCQRDQLVAHGDASVVNGGADHHRAVRAHRGPGGREVGVAELHARIAQADAERVGGYLG